MKTARVVVCTTLLVVVIWYSSSIHHQLLTPLLCNASITNTMKHQHALKGDSRASSHQPSVTQGNTTELSSKNETAYDSANPTLQSHAQEGWESIMHGRLARVNEVCKKHPKELMRFDLYGVFNSLTVEPIHHLVYCRNAKAGTTTWLSRLLTWAGISLTDTSSNNIHRVAKLIFPTMPPDKMMQELRRPAVAFTVARHPFHRLVSAYRNKVQGSENYKTYLWPNMMKYRKGMNNKTVLENSRPTFREFALYASDQVRQCLGRARPSCLQKIDVHWQPHHDRCAPCNIKYDAIIKMETKDEDEAYLSHLLGLPLPKPAQQNEASGNSTSYLAKTFFATLSKSERQQVFEAYKFDFLMFDYSYDDKDYT